MKRNVRLESVRAPGKVVPNPCYRHTKLLSRAQGELPEVSLSQLERNMSDTTTGVHHDE